MGMTVDHLVFEARKLSPEKRAELLDRLHLELRGESLSEVPAEWNRVAVERLAAVEDGRSQTHSGEEVLSRMRRLIGR